MKMTQVQTSNIINAIENAVNALNNLKTQLGITIKDVDDVFELLPNTDSVKKAVNKITRSRKVKSYTNVGDYGYYDSPNPTRQATGQIGGMAGIGVKHTSTPRRPRGSVNCKDMDINEKRLYWRWSDARKKCIKLGQEVPSWDEWVVSQMKSI